MTVIRDGAVVANLTIGDSYALGVDPTTHTVYLTNNSSNTVSVIHGTTLAAAVPVGPDPTAIAVDRSTQDVYVTNAADDTVSLIASDGS